MCSTVELDLHPLAPGHSTDQRRRRLVLRSPICRHLIPCPRPTESSRQEGHATCGRLLHFAEASTPTTGGFTLGAQHLVAFSPQLAWAIGFEFVKVSSKHPLCSELSNSRQATVKSSSWWKAATPRRSENVGQLQRPNCLPHNMATPATCCNGPDTRSPLSTMSVAAPLLQRCPPPREDILESAQDYPQIASTRPLCWISQCLRQTTTGASALLQNEVLLIAPVRARRHPCCLATDDSLGRWWSPRTSQGQLPPAGTHKTGLAGTCFCIWPSILALHQTPAHSTASAGSEMKIVMHMRLAPSQCAH